MKYVLKILALMAIPGMAAAGNCLPVVGTVKLTTDSSCSISNKYSLDLPQFYLGDCYTTNLKLLGFGTSTGSSGVTSEQLTSLLPGPPLPIIPPIPPVPTPTIAPSGQTILTARSWIPIPGTKDSYGQYTEIFASEIIIGSPNRVTEQSVIMKTNGKGIFKDINGGGFVILGDARGREVPIQGEFCFP